MEDLKSLEKKLKTAKIKNQLEKLGILDGKKESREKFPEKDSTMKELQEAQKIKNKIVQKIDKENISKPKKFVKKFLATASLNKTINEKKTFLHQKQQIKNLEQAEKIQASRARLNELRKRNNVTIDSLSAMSGEKSHKPIKFEDLF